ncbi:complement decay-accelerating factor, partial [Antrostomus carolinensis]|uniref:complement decay-accelerating factor n=1 Tax=Antrostomus carolinensis TaxID=279965 RepID=UPI0010A980C2
DCGPLPNITHAEPPEDTKHQESFSVGSKVTYRCLTGYVKRPLLSDTIQCLTNSQWSNLQEFCGRSCSDPPHVQFATISQEDEIRNFYAVNTTVKYICRPGYERITDQLLTSTCLDNLTWSEVPELCRTVSCPPPPVIPNGTHNSNGTEEFVYDSVVMYTCDPGLQLVGNETLRCTTENSVDGMWSGSPPECRVSTAAATNHTEPSEKKIAENLYLLAAIIMKQKCNKKHSYSMPLQSQEMKGRDPPMHPRITDEEKQPVPWHSYFCHTTSCHVCPTCEERLHAALAPHAEPTRHGCATCKDWLDTQPGTAHTYSVPSIDIGENQNPVGTRINPSGCSILSGTRLMGLKGELLHQLLMF